MLHIVMHRYMNTCGVASMLSGTLLAGIKRIMVGLIIFTNPLLKAIHRLTPELTKGHNVIIAFIALALHLILLIRV